MNINGMTGGNRQTQPYAGCPPGSWLDGPSREVRKPCGCIHLGLPGQVHPAWKRCLYSIHSKKQVRTKGMVCATPEGESQ